MKKEIKITKWSKYIPRDDDLKFIWNKVFTRKQIIESKIGEIKARNDKGFNSNLKKFWKKVWVFILWVSILFFIWGKIIASANQDIDSYIEKLCMKNELADEIYFKDYWTHGERCTLILQWQIRFETELCSIWNGLKWNCFGWRWWKRTDWENEYGMYYDWTWSYRFNNKYDSIRFAVDHYYKWQLYKNIEQIIKGGWYCSPKTGWCFILEGFARTTEERYNNYIFAVKKHFFNNFNK